MRKEWGKLQYCLLFIIIMLASILTFAALSWQSQELKHRHCDTAQLWQTRAAHSLSCYLSTRNWTQFWLTGKFEFVEIVGKP